MLFDEKLKERVKDTTATSYDDENEITNCENMVEDLLYEIEHRDEVITELKSEIEDNYGDFR